MLDYWIAASSGRAISQKFCEDNGRLVVDRSDFLSDNDWRAEYTCAKFGAVQMVPENEWLADVIVAGTGLFGIGPWRQGDRSGPTLDAAVAGAPWQTSMALTHAMRLYDQEPSTAVLLRAYDKVLEYDVPAILRMIPEIHDDDTAFEQLAERACELDFETCGESAEALATRSRDDAAMRLWKRSEGGEQIRSLGRIRWDGTLMFCWSEEKRKRRCASLSKRGGRETRG